MSTRCTLAYGPDFHLFVDCMDDDTTGPVYLELSGPNFEYEASSRQVTLTIPRAIWETVRHHGGADLILADATDEELRRRASEGARKRMEELAGEPTDSICRIFGIAYFGPSSDPQDVQAERAFAELVKEREKQMALRDEIEAARRG
jgi:hypothetical protein